MASDERGGARRSLIALYGPLFQRLRKPKEREKMKEEMKELIGIFFNRAFGLTLLAFGVLALIAQIDGVLQAVAFRGVAIAVVIALGVLLAAASMMGSANEKEIIRRLERVETQLARLVDKVDS
jgi:hypothetical protein